MQREFAIEMKDGVVTKIGKSTVSVPEVQWNGDGIKWFDDSQLLKKNPTYKVFITDKQTYKVREILATSLTLDEAESYCSSWGWNYDDGHKSYWMDYEEE